jgi:hypothetical protein
MSSGYLNPVATDDVVRTLAANKNSPAWLKLDGRDKFESEGVQYDMNVSAIRDRNRDAARAQDGDEAGEDCQHETTRPTLVDDVAALESENT